MKIKHTITAMVLALSCFTINANAQKTYTEGTATYALGTSIGELEGKILFTADSNAFLSQQGPANIKVLANTKGTFGAILVDVSLLNLKKAAILTPEEVKKTEADAPKYSFTTTTETKQINGFNTKKVIAKDPKNGSTIEIWVTNDIKAPVNNLTKLFAGAGGYPVQFKTTQSGQTFDATLKSITQEKLPAGTFGIPSDYERITMAELNALGGQQ